MTSITPGTPRQRREKGSGSKPRWDAGRQQYAVNVTLADGKKRTIRGKTEREVEKARDVLLGKIEHGIPTPSTVLTVERYLLEWLESVRVSTLPGKAGARTKRKRGTHRDYESLVRMHILPTIGKLPLATLSVDQVQRKLIDAKLKSGSSARRVAMMRDVLRAALSRAHRMGLVSQNVAKLVEVDSVINSRIGEALTPEQTERMLQATKDHRYWALFTVLVTCGMRLGEALALQWSDIDFKRRTVRIEKTLERMPGEPWTLEDVKGRHESGRRTIPLIAPAIDALLHEQDRQTFTRRRVGEDLWLDNKLVFSNDRGDAVYMRVVQDQWKATLKRAGLDETKRVHDLRHTCASYLHMLGVPNRTIMAIMGHSTLAMTQRYSHVFDASLDEARDKLDGLFSRMSETPSQLDRAPVWRLPHS